MDKKSLRQLSKSELIRRLISTSEALLAERDARLTLEKRVAELERRLLAYENEHTPSSKKRKKNTRKRGNGPRFPGKPKGGTGGGIRLPPVDKVQEHTLKACPRCEMALGDALHIRTRRVVDLPEQPIVCTEHWLHEYHCPRCDCIVAPKVDLPPGPYGPRLKAASVLLKKAGLSFEKIATFWCSIRPLSIRAPTILGFLDLVGVGLAKTRGAFLRAAKKTLVAHKDETGFRRDGQNGWVWGLFTQNHALYVVDPSRGKHVAARLRGDRHQISVVDGYQGYNDDPRRARCWEHLRRKAEGCAEAHPETQDQVQRLLALYMNVLQWSKEPPDERRSSQVEWELADIARCLRSRAGGRELAVHIENGREDWLTCLKVLEVPATNNHGERGLRPIVLHRKIMGCFRNEKGKRFFEVVMSVLTTWELRGHNLFRLLVPHLT